MRAARRPASRHSVKGCASLGYVEGKNIVIEYRYAEGKLDRLNEFAAELVRLRWTHRDSGCISDPCRQGSHFDDSRCHGAG